MADFLWRSHQFESALRETSRALLGGDRRVVLAWFGDHQPPFGTALRLRDGMLPVWNGAQPVHPGHVTWYHVASNARGRTAPRAPAPLDVVFLPGLLAHEAGVALDDWLAANVVAAHGCGGAFARCASPRTREAYLSYLLH